MASNLGAANVIFASFFDGDGEFVSAPGSLEDGCWANVVTDYGALILNDSSNPKATTTSSADPADTNSIFNGGEPARDVINPTAVTIRRLNEYSRIIDGVVMQPGKWESTGSYPAKDLTPDLSQRPVLRLKIQGSIADNPRVLLTGLTERYVISGEVGLDGSTDTLHPEDGDFLGPSVFPWAAKVIFTAPTYYSSYASVNKISAGSGIGVSPSSGIGDVTISNTGVLSATPGTGIKVNNATSGAQTGAVTITNSGVLSVSAGDSYIGATTSSGAVTVTNKGVHRAKGGTGIQVNSDSNWHSNDDITITNTGVTSATPGTGIKINNATSGAQTGAITITNNGVTSVTAGAGISLSGSSGSVKITNTIGEYTPTDSWSTLPWGDSGFYYEYANGFGLFDANDSRMKKDPYQTIAFSEVPKIKYRHVDGLNYTDVRISFSAGDGDPFRLGNRNLMPSARADGSVISGRGSAYFTFAHNDYHSGLWDHSVICALQLTSTGKSALLGGDSSKWASAYAISETDVPQMWKVYHYESADPTGATDLGLSESTPWVPGCWGVTCRVDKCSVSIASSTDLHATYNSSQTSSDKLVFFAQDIFDGYNRHYDAYLPAKGKTPANIWAWSSYLECVLNFKIVWS